MPVVLESRTRRDATSLAAFVACESRTIKSVLHEHGAILFRGFDVTRDGEFEDVVTSFEGTRPMSGYFMSEPGRHRIEGTRAVFNTNALYKTGGALYLGGFHSENFYSADVPALQSMWCKEPPAFGGETAIVQTANVWEDLPALLQRKLAAGRVLAREVRVADVAGRYGLSQNQVVTFCRQIGLEVADGGADVGEVVQVWKPVVFKHPSTGRRALQVNVSGEVASLDAALRRLFAPNYRNWRWAAHRLGWRSPKLAAMLPALESWPLFVDAATATFEGALSRLREGGRVPARPAQAPSSDRFGARLDVDDVETLARAIWRNTSLFTWQRGDVLVFDNLQVLHAGMPGRGQRELRVMMCDPIPMPLPIASGEIEVVFADSSYEPIGARLESFAKRFSTEGRRPAV